ncbi:MAG: metallophosphoesterase family protein [Candidatus Woesearchaeota archaeon]
MKKPIFKALGFTDPHATGKSPRSRKDILFETLLKKFNNVLEIGQRENVDIYLCAGDIFDTSDVSNNIARQIGEALNKFDKPIYCIPGNHDIEYNNLESVPYTKLGLLAGLGIISLIDYEDVILFKKNGIKIQITGSPCTVDINKNKEALILSQKQADIAIHMAHAMILKGDSKFGDYVPLNDIMDITKADITFSGDFHLGFPVTWRNNKAFANPGALVRKYNFLEEMNRIPQVLLITVYDDKTFNAEYIPLDCALPGSEVLDRETLIAQKEYENELKNFSDNLFKKKADTLVQSIEDIIYLISRDEEIEQEIIDLTLEYIENAARTLGWH